MPICYRRGYLIERHATFDFKHILSWQIINGKNSSLWTEKKITAALGNAPSGMNTLKAFITRFMATKVSIHDSLFFSGKAGTVFHYAFSTVIPANNLR